MALFGRESPRDQERVEAYRAWYARQHPLALASALLSIFSLTHFGTLFIDELAGIAFGILAIRSAPKTPLRSIRFAYLGIAIGIVSLACAIVIYCLPAAAK